jgi:tripartite-type tricarboxylate transporter receptor subunit TctC
MRQFRRQIACLFLTVVPTIPLSWAQTFPAKPVRVVVPYAPGGVINATARLVAEKLTQSLGQAVVVDNKTGAAGRIGADTVAKAAPDGYTLLIASPGEVTINQSLYKKMAYSPEADLAAVTLLANAPLVLVVNPEVAAMSVKDLVNLAKKSPGQLSFASAGAGSVPHLAGESLKYLANIDVIHVPYKGGGPATIDLLGGRVSFAFLGLAPIMGHIKSGKLRALAISSPRRSANAPDIPTVEEVMGWPSFDYSNWIGAFVPASTPPATIAKLQEAMAAAIASPRCAPSSVSKASTPLEHLPRNSIDSGSRTWKNTRA